MGKNRSKVGVDRDTVCFSPEGTYVKSLWSWGREAAEVEQTITVESEDPAGCVNTLWSVRDQPLLILLNVKGS